MAAKAAEHDVAGIAQREDNFGRRKEFVDERQLGRIQRMLVDEHLPIERYGEFAQSLPIERTHVFQLLAFKM